MQRGSKLPLSVRFDNFFLLAYFTIELIFASIYGSNYTFWYYL